MSVREVQGTSPAVPDVVIEQAKEAESLPQLMQHAFDPATAKRACSAIYKRIDQGNVEQTVIRDFFNRKFQVNRAHMQPKMAVKDEAAPKADINDLLRMFDAINFTDPAKPHFYDPKKFQSGLARVQKDFYTFIHNVCYKVQLPELKRFSEDKRNVFYDELHSALQQVTSLLPKVQDIETRTAWLIDLALAPQFSPTRWLAEPKNIIELIKFIQAEEVVSPNLEENVFDHLRGTRHLTLDGVGGGNDVHWHKYKMNAIGKNIGLTDAEPDKAFCDPYLPENLPTHDALLHDFDKRYQPYDVFAAVTEGMNTFLLMNADMVSSWFAAHTFSDWKDKAVRIEAIVFFAVQAGILQEK